MNRRPPPTLRGRALMWLAQREHSRAELRQKLRRWAAVPDAAETDGRPAAGDADIERLLDELEAARQLSDTRFAESRVHARQARFGNRRIRLELQHLGVTLDPEVSDQLKASERARAREVQLRKFGQLPVSADERARQTRFLAARGFTAETIRQILQSGDDD